MGRRVETDVVRGQLVSLGAPLYAEPSPVEDLEETLVRGVSLSREHGVVARVFPLVLYVQRDRVRVDRLLAAAERLGQRRAVGFFLDLVGEVSHDVRFSAWAERFRDASDTDVQGFFPEDLDPRRPLLVEMAEKNTPSTARRWNLRMNMGLDAFSDTFERYTRA